MQQLRHHVETKDRVESHHRQPSTVQYISNAPAQHQMWGQKPGRTHHQKTQISTTSPPCTSLHLLPLRTPLPRTLLQHIKGKPIHQNSNKTHESSTTNVHLSFMGKTNLRFSSQSLLTKALIRPETKARRNSVVSAIFVLYFITIDVGVTRNWRPLTSGKQNPTFFYVGWEKLMSLDIGYAKRERQIK